jgi:hypothetical protein
VSSTRSGGLGVGASVGSVGVGASVGGDSAVGVGIGGIGDRSAGSASDTGSRPLSAVEVRALENQARSPDVDVRVRAQRLLNANASLLSGAEDGEIAKVSANALDDAARADLRVGTLENGLTDTDANVRIGNGEDIRARADADDVAGNDATATLGIGLGLGGGDDGGGGGDDGAGDDTAGNDGMSADQRFALIRRCGMVMRSPAQYDPALVKLCQSL